MERTRGERLSRHPADRLIREIIREKREPTTRERVRITARLATAPFNLRVVGVPSHLRGLRVGDSVLGARADSLSLHLARRVAVDRQWQATDESAYLTDLRGVAGAPSAAVWLYASRGGN